MAIEGAIIEVREGYFFTLSLEFITYEGKDKKTAKGKLGGIENDFLSAQNSLRTARTFLEQELRK